MNYNNHLANLVLDPQHWVKCPNNWFEIQQLSNLFMAEGSNSMLGFILLHSYLQNQPNNVGSIRHASFMFDHYLGSRFVSDLVSLHPELFVMHGDSFMFAGYVKPEPEATKSESAATKSEKRAAQAESISEVLPRCLDRLDKGPVASNDDWMLWLDETHAESNLAYLFARKLNSPLLPTHWDVLRAWLKKHIITVGKQFSNRHHFNCYLLSLANPYGLTQGAVSMYKEMMKTLSDAENALHSPDEIIGYEYGVPFNSSYQYLNVATGEWMDRTKATDLELFDESKPYLEEAPVHD